MLKQLLMVPAACRSTALLKRIDQVFSRKTGSGTMHLARPTISEQSISSFGPASTARNTVEFHSLGQKISTDVKKGERANLSCKAHSAGLVVVLAQ